jgi:hypothetical protein
MPNVSFGSMLRKSAVYAIAILAPRALSFALIPLYTRYLTPADYGVLELLDLTLNLIIVFAGSRLGQAFYYYFAEPDEVIRAHHMSKNPREHVAGIHPLLRRAANGNEYLTARVRLTSRKD